MHPILQQKIKRVAARHRALRLWSSLAACWAGAGFLGLGLLAVQRQSAWTSPLVIPSLLLLAAVASIIVLWKLGDIADIRTTAREIELRHPELDGRLLTAIESEDTPSSHTSYFRQRLLRELLQHEERKDWADLVPRSRINVAQTAHWLAVGLLAFALWGLKPVPQKQGLASEYPVSGVNVSPGDTLLEKGSSLVVMARFGGRLPSTVELVIPGATGEVQRITLVKSLADPMFGGSIPEVFSNFAYRVEYAGSSTRDFHVRVFEYPKLERADASLVYPEYTGLQHKVIENTRRLSAVQGTMVDFTLKLNKPVRSATFVSKDQQHSELPLEVQPGAPLAFLKGFHLASSGTYDLLLRDDEGRTNKVASQFVFSVLTNRLPELRFVTPRGDQRPSPLEEVAFEATVWDDFGVSSYGIGYTVAGSDTVFVELGGHVPAKEKRTFKHLLSLEDLHLEPDQLISWFVWADDAGPDGELRRSSSDLFFGEIRPFDEIFREGQSMAGMEGQQQGGQGGGEQGSPSGKLAEIQKQIISATWKVQRDKGGFQRKAQAGDTNDQSSVERNRDAGQVAQVSNLLYRRLPVGRLSEPLRAAAGWKPAILQVENLRYRQSAHREYETSTPSTVASVASALRSNRGVLASPAEQPPEERSGRSRQRAGNARPAARDRIDVQADAEVLQESQSEALNQARSVLEQVQDPRAAALWRSAIYDMEKALKNLKDATGDPARYSEALAAEQAAYQALLKLQEHEFQVSRSRRQNSGQSGGRQSQMQRQLEQMELTQSENRYETQRQAQRAESSERREQLQVLNRLQELARRQQDLNERLKELQSALQEARTEQEKEELRRQLKRLQEQEQQMLADIDELRQRMDQPENQSRMAEQRQQLDQTRQEVQQAADAAAQGSPSQALASGTRAQNQLQEMRDQLRQENSSEFAEDLREMRNQARELERRQQEILDNIRNAPSTERRSLSDSSQRDQALEHLARQNQQMTNLVDRATEISQQAEMSEPLLSRQLHDTVRKFSQDTSQDVKDLQERLLMRGMMTRSLMDRLRDESASDASKLLDTTAEMLKMEFQQPAAESAERAKTGFSNLRQGVERAAESVLGDDTEALRMAQEQLDRLTDQLQREMAAAQGGGSVTNQGSAGNRSGTNELTDAAASNGQGTNQLSLAGNQPGNGSTNAPGQTQPSQGRGSRNGTETAQQQSQPGQPGQPGSEGSEGSQQSQNQGEGQQGSQTTAQNESGGGGQGGNNPQDANNQNARGRDRQNRELAQGRGNRDGNRTQGGRRGANLGGADGGGAEGGDISGSLQRAFDRMFDDTPDYQAGPLLGEGYLSWSDRLRDVEEMIELPDLRNEVSRIRDRARQMRQDYKRDLKKPDWAVVRLQVVNPLVEVRDRISEELAKRESREALVPIDRDPVPTRYSDLVKRYYEQLGKSEPSSAEPPSASFE